MTEIAIIGGGIGGLSAAHELAERGFDVAIYESNDRFGGKARSIPIDDGPDSLQGEHGFRFFPAFYRHVIDTMDRIPDGDGSVADNLVETEETLIASTDGPGQIAETRRPTTLREWLETMRPAFADDLPPEDVRFLLERLLYVLTACEDRREELDNVSWWEFVDAENRSPEFRERIAYTVQSLVALRPQVGSARTLGTIYLQLLFGQIDPTRATERVLNAPTNEAWIDPWIAYLEDLGVSCHPNSPVRELEFDGQRISSIRLAGGEAIAADDYVLAVPLEVATQFVTPAMARTAPSLGRIKRLETAWMNGIQFYLADDLEVTRGHQVYADSPWALTSISQRQFWTGYDLKSHGPETVEGVLSVIVSDWDTPGPLFGKPASACTREEVATEVWAQMKSHLNAERTRVTDDILVDWFLDPALLETDDGLENQSPLLINTVGSLRHRPPADVSIENLTLSADYVRTNTDLASMESAVEAGHRATNAILERHSYRGEFVPVWDLEEPAVFEPFKRQDRLRYRLGLPHPAAVTHSLRTMTKRLTGDA